MPEESNSTPTQDAQVPASAEATSSDGSIMHVKVYAPFKVYFDGVANSISATNDTGPFDVLSRHHNFMTLLSEGDIVVRTENGEEKIPIQRGIMHVKKNEIVVFLDV